MWQDPGPIPFTIFNVASSSKPTSAASGETVRPNPKKRDRFVPANLSLLRLGDLVEIISFRTSRSSSRSAKTSQHHPLPSSPSSEHSQYVLVMVYLRLNLIHSDRFFTSSADPVGIIGKFGIVLAVDEVKGKVYVEIDDEWVERGWRYWIPVKCLAREWTRRGLLESNLEIIDERRQAISCAISFNCIPFMCSEDRVSILPIFDD